MDISLKFWKLHPTYGVPRFAMMFNLMICFVFLFLFKGWGVLAEVISSSYINFHMLLDQ